MFIRKIKLLTTFVIILVLASSGVVFAESATDGPPTVRVSGAGAITTAPDMATISLGVTIQEASAAEAIRKNNATIADVLAAVKALGINESDIATQRFSLRQAFDVGDFTQSRPIGYTVTNSVIVTLRDDLDKVGDVIGAGVAAGANVSAGVNFGLNETSPVYYEALEIAIADAANKARTLARALGTTVTGISAVIETNTFAAPIAGGAVAEQGAADMSWAMRASMDSFGVPISAGDLSIVARVEVVYVLAQ